MKIAYCGYDFFHACLIELLAGQYDVYRVFTFPCDNQFNFNLYIREICDKHNLPLTDLQVDEAVVKELEKEGCELIITAGYRYKVPDLTRSSMMGINVHPTLLPVGRGIWPLPGTILTDQHQSGVTIHKLSEEYDAGDVLLQQSFPLTTDERLESLSAKVQLVAKDLLLKVMADFDSYWVHSRPQTGDTSVWDMPDREQRTLSWQLPVKDLDRTCRAFGKFGCYATFNEQNWVVYGLTAWKQAHDFTIGSVVHKTNTEMIVAASDGLVSLLYFEPAPK
jgi:methionyl-tRNA formyltransferase